MDESYFTRKINDECEFSPEELSKNQRRKRLRMMAKHASEVRCNTCICVLENPRNMANIGTVIRNVNAIGISKLYIVDGYNIFKNKQWPQFRTDQCLMNSSVSAVKWTYVKTFKTTQECMEHLQKNNYVSMCTSPYILGKKNTLLHEGTYTQKKLAVWFGNESDGISTNVVNECDECIQLEMNGIIESFNLATCTGIVLTEVARQRRQFKKLKSNI